ncbi:MAG: hypothetical protein ABJ308_01530 [Halieaceae bacterium]
MEQRRRRPIILALLLSSTVHLLTLAALQHWFPAATTGFPSLRLSLLEAPQQSLDRPPQQSPAKRSSVQPTATTQASPPELPQALAATPLPPSALTAAPELELNPVPRLQEEFEIGLASLAVEFPMESDHRQILQTALHRWQQQLPAWTDSDEPLRWRQGEQEFRASVERLAPDSAMDLERAILDVRTEIDGLSLSAQVPVKRLAFSAYAQLVDRWDPEISLANDQIDGRFHSNSPLLVEVDAESGPRVTGMTTVSGRVTMRRSGKRAEVFSGGLQTWARKIPLPQRAFPWRELAVEQERLHFIEADTQLLFDADGSYRWQALGVDQASGIVSLPDQPWLIIADDGVRLQVQGTVRGSVLVYSPQRITITGSLAYARDPRRQADSPDYLGLVSEKTVEVAGVAVTGPGDISIAAAIYARRRFRIRDYRDPGAASLSIYGSVTAGSLSATEPRFVTRVQFDRRLQGKRPAYFPQTDHYELEQPNPSWVLTAVAQSPRGSPH